MMAVKIEAKSQRHKDDAVNLLILLFIASLLGVYLITTTVLIAEDGVHYIERAQKFLSDPSDVIVSHPPGYPYLIFIAYKFVGLFSNSPSVQTWVYSAQSITLLCRLLAIIPLYFIGKLLVGSRNSFWALLILILLPYPAKFGSDALRDWPHVLFLASGFLFLLWGAKDGRWWMFGIAGLAGGLGHIIRPECAQLVIYGILWLLIRLFLPTHNMNRPKLVCALFILLIGFAIPTVPYIKAGRRIFPKKLEVLISSSYELQSERIQDPNIDCHNNVYTASSLPSNVVKAIGRLIAEISDNLMYFFVPALVVGIYFHFHKQSGVTDIERFFVPAFIILNIIMLILLYCEGGYISRRHSLPLVVFTIFYVSVGLQVIADRLVRSSSGDGNGANIEKARSWFFVLLVIGLGICTPKLLRPIRVEKQAYRVAAKWLKENTSREDTIAVPNERISFYAERKGFVYEIGEVTKRVKYVVKIVKSEDEELNFPKDMQVQEVHSVWVDKWGRKRKLVIYKTMCSGTDDDRKNPRS